MDLLRCKLLLLAKTVIEFSYTYTACCVYVCCTYYNVRGCITALLKDTRGECKLLLFNYCYYSYARIINNCYGRRRRRGGDVRRVISFYFAHNVTPITTVISPGLERSIGISIQTGRHPFRRSTDSCTIFDHPTYRLSDSSISTIFPITVVLMSRSFSFRFQYEFKK